MSSSPLSYATYQGHRRGQSTSTSHFQGHDEGGSGGEGGGGGTTTTISPKAYRPTVSITQPVASPSQRPSPASKASMIGSGDGPPPLRTISSLRTSALPSTSSSSSSGKGKETESATSEVSSRNIARRAVSSSLAVPSSSTNKEIRTSSPAPPADSIQAKTNGHNKSHSYSPSPNSRASPHLRSASGSTGPPILPVHISTAQRLRSVNATPTNSLSNASSPTGTPRGLSPSLEAMSGLNGQSTFSASSASFAADTIGRRTAYRPGFQPRGTYRVRTDEFTAARERKGKGKSMSSSNKAGEETKVRNELESQRLERRLEKLVALHYESVPVSLETIPTWLPNAIRKTRQMAEEEKRIREEEMRIVKWEQDSSRKLCPLCSTPFSLSVRKHHCRLCGRIVCASPHLSVPPGFDSIGDASLVKDGRKEEVKCSSLVVADGKAGTMIKDKPVWEDRNDVKESIEGTNRGIRICKECRETIMHRQYMLDDGKIPAYLRLYEGLITLQKEIEQSLPEFQEMVLGLQKQDAAAALGTAEEASQDILSPSTSDTSTSSAAASALAALKAKNKNSLALQRDAAQARKQLLANFANYDLIAKKIRNLDDQGNASLARIKMAIWTKANLFLQQNMFPLQSLPKLSNSKKEKKKVSSGINTPTSSGNGSDAGETVRPFRALLQEVGPSDTQSPRVDAKADARAMELIQKDPKAAKESLVVLEQQLGLVLEYAASAAKARKFQDAKSLKNSAQDLEKEIARLRKLGIS